MEEPDGRPLLKPPASTDVTNELKTLIQRHSAALSSSSKHITLAHFNQARKKAFAIFRRPKPPKLIRITEGYLRQVASEMPDVSNVSAGGTVHIRSRRSMRFGSHWTVGLEETSDTYPGAPAPSNSRSSTVMNFKGGRERQRRRPAVAQYLALRGYRVLAIDLDPQASLSALFGHQPELDVGPNETLYGAIRYDEESARSPRLSEQRISQISIWCLAISN